MHKKGQHTNKSAQKCHLRVTDLQINPRILEAVQRAGLWDVGDILGLSGSELERLTRLTSSDITTLKDAIAETVMGEQFGRSLTALKMLGVGDPKITGLHKLTTGSYHLDQALRGGMLAGCITEVVGESGAGKTQLCLQLCLNVQLPISCGGLEGGAVYISTEGAFPISRLSQMAKVFSLKHQDSGRSDFLSCIKLQHVAELEHLDDCLDHKLPAAMGQGLVRLVVIDSVAALFRCHYGNRSLVARAKHLASIGTKLRRLAQKYNAVIICVNQVSANMSKGSAISDRVRQDLPALGPVWADQVMCRFMMSLRPDTSGCSWIGDEGSGPDTVCAQPAESRKLLEVVFAPHLPPTAVPLLVTAKGVE